MTLEEATVALAEALHDESSDCNANYFIPFAECEFREMDIREASDISDWQLVRQPASVVGMGL